MSRDEQQLRCDIVEVGRRLYARGLIGGHEGNVSVRLESSLLITPAGVCKGFLTPDMIVRTDLAGRPQDGGRASTETLMHTAVYRRRGDVHAVVHAHPPTATAFAVAGIALDRPLTAEAVVTLGPVPLIPYGQPSTVATRARARGTKVSHTRSRTISSTRGSGRPWPRYPATTAATKRTRSRRRNNTRSRRTRRARNTITTCRPCRS